MLSRGKLKKLAGGSLGQEIQALREALGYTQVELAETLEVDPSTVQNWERGRSSPRRRMLAKLRTLAPLPASPEPGRKKKGGESDELRVALHAALDIVLEGKAPETVRESVVETLMKYGGRPWRER